MKFGLPLHIVQKIQHVLARFPEINEAIIYGSRAKGNFRPGSDIDLTLKGPALTDAHYNPVWLALDDLNLPWMFDLSVFNTLASPDLEAHIERVGQVFYSAGAEISK